MSPPRHRLTTPIPAHRRLQKEERRSEECRSELRGREGGFATAIPALSKATVRVSLQGTGDSVYIAELTDVTVEGVRYGVQADLVAVPGPQALPSEITFTLLKQVSIQR
jgi:hypothetical protein